MTNTHPLHSVIIITYNQEKLIGRALDSVLCQKEYLYEIIVCDDCSTDNNWEVIQDYQKKHPQLIKPYRNPQNLGIFGNIESTWSKPGGNIIWYLSGDDAYCNGLFANANTLIAKNTIDLENDFFTLYFDYKAITPSGKETVFRNKLIQHYNPISLNLRHLICNRTTGFSKNLLKKFYPVRKDVGIYADWLMDLQIQVFSEKNFYSPFIGSYYYTNIGISSITKREDALNSSIISLEQLKEDLKNLSKNDEYWINYLQSQLSCSLTPSLQNYIIYYKLFFLMIQEFFGWSFIMRETKNILKDTIKTIILKLK